MATVTRSIRIGLASVKANALPMFVLWGVALATIWAYYRLPGAAEAFEPIVRWQTESGWMAAFANRVVFCGLVPGAFMAALPSIRPKHVGLVILAYALWGGIWGVLYDGFATLLVQWFGTGTDWATLAKKTLVDQFVWNVLLCTPAGALFYPWVARDFRRGERLSLGRFVCEDCVVILASNWLIWIPVMLAVYAFPLALQIQLVGFASSFWMLVALWTGGRK